MTCPCCGYRTIADEYDTCQVCQWTHDFAQEADPDEAAGHNTVSLREAQRNFLTLGAITARLRGRARSPTPDDTRDPAWQPLPRAGPVSRT